jgi:VanZ family protein
VSPRGPGFSFPWRTLHLVALLALLGLWTWKLLVPNPVPEAIAARLTGQARHIAGKVLHGVAYGVLTLLAVTLPVPNYWRWYSAGLLALHGVATEIGQTFVPGRTGRVWDVVIDWAGLTVAVVMWQLARGRARRTGP